MISSTYFSPYSMPVPHKTYLSALFILCPLIYEMLSTHADLGFALTRRYRLGEIHDCLIHSVLKGNIRICICHRSEHIPELKRIES